MSATDALPGRIDGAALADTLRAGIYRLFARTDHLNRINVFPVPDGDTGTNLAMTSSAVLGEYATIDAAGFIELIEGMSSFFDTGEVGEARAPPHDSGETMSPGGSEGEHRYCTACVVTGEELGQRSPADLAAAARVAAAVEAMRAKTRSWGLLATLDHAVRGGRVPAVVRTLSRALRAGIHATRLKPPTSGRT